MPQDFWHSVEERLYSLIPPLLLIYIFFQPFNHFAGIRNTAFYSMLLLFLVKLVRKGIDIDWKDSLVVAIFILLSAIFISIIFSNYRLDSINAFRKNFFHQFIVFFVILIEFRSAKDIKALLSTIVLSFVTVTLIIFIKNTPANLLNIPEVKKYKESFLGGYALNAAFYIPFTLGYLFSIKDKIKIMMRGFLWVMLFAEFALVWLYYNSRTTLVAILFSAVTIILLSKRYKMLLIIVAVFLGVVGFCYFKKPELVDRYKTLLSFQTYISRDGLSHRKYIWQGTFDMIKASPIVGYGYGWKKIATVARDGGYIEKWKEKRPNTYNYFNKTNYGSTNPHNLALQILFEIGIVGFVAFILFWITVIIKIIKVVEQGTGNELSCFVKYGGSGVLVSYFLVNLANGLWEESYGVITFALAAIITVVYEQNKCKNN